MKEINEQDLEKEEERLRELSIFLNYEGTDEIITSEQAWKLLEEERSKPTPKFFSKIPALDAMLDGFRQGDLVVVSGPTKMGKTTLCQTLTHNLAANQIPCLWFSYELTQQEFLEKFGEPIPYFLLPKHLEGNSLDWIERKIIESIAKFGTKVVFIDHLHFLLDMSWLSQRGGGISLLIGGIMRQLKRIALKWNIAICLVAHTTKIRFEAQPELADIRDSSFISQEADTVLMIYRAKDKEGEFTNKAVLMVLANRRNGKVGKILLQLKDGKFYEETISANNDSK